MTRQEAKKYLIEHCNPDYPSCGRLEWDRAMDVAIRALEQDDVIDRVLEIINEIEHDMGHTALIGNDNKFAGVLCNSREFRDRVLALKGGEYEDAGNDSCRWASD